MGVEPHVILERLDLVNLVAGFVLTLLGTITVWLIKGAYEFRRASANLRIDIAGKWYSAEFDTKDNVHHQERNTCLDAELKRRLGNKVIIRSKVGEVLDNRKAIQTNWIVKGTIVGETLVG